MSYLTRYLPFIEFLYFAYGMLFLNWSISVTIFYLWLSLVIYYPFGFVNIAMAAGKKARALITHFLFYGFGLFIWTFILLIAMNSIMAAEWQLSLDSAIIYVPSYLFVVVIRYILTILFNYLSKAEQQTVTKVFYLGIWKLIFMFIVMFPTVLILMNFKNGANIIVWILVIAFFILEIKKLGQHYTKEELKKLEKQMGFD